MKFANKLMIVPYNYSFEAPIKNYLSTLDQEMNEILNQKLPDDQKVKLYNSILVKYKSNYDPIVYENQPANIEKITSLIEDVKKETKELDEDLKNQYSELNVKLEQYIDDKDQVKKLVKQDLMNKSISRAKKTKLKKQEIEGNKEKNVLSKQANDTNIENYESNIEEKQIKKAKRKNTDTDKIIIKKNKLEEHHNESMMDYEDNNVLDTAMNKTNPAMTRSQYNEYEAAKAKANNVINPNINDIQTLLKQTKLIKPTSKSLNSQPQNGKGKIKWSTKKFF